MAKVFCASPPDDPRDTGRVPTLDSLLNEAKVTLRWARKDRRDAEFTGDCTEELVNAVALAENEVERLTIAIRARDAKRKPCS